MLCCVVVIKSKKVHTALRLPFVYVYSRPGARILSVGVLDL